jgi:CNT family concentrative nucleoside transporter
MLHDYIGLLGIPAILGIGVALSSNRQAIKPKLIAWGLGFQLALALFILKTSVGARVFQHLGAAVAKLLEFSDAGSAFIFGDLIRKPETFGFIFAFKVLPAIIFVGALMNIAYYLGIMQVVVSFVAKIMVKTMGTSGAESLSAVGTVFVGQSEAPLLIKPYIPEMTRSELMAIMTGGMATIAGSVMASFIGMLGSEWAPHLLAASIMGAPAGLVMAKLMEPETGEPKTKGEVKMEVEKTESSVIEAAAKGALDGMHLAFIVGALLIAFIALIALINHLLGLTSLLGMPPLSMELILGWVFSPLTFLMGVPSSDIAEVGGLLGKKIVLNEFVAYSELSNILKGADPAGRELTKEGTTIATFALCGFANLSSIAINIGCVGGIAPERRGELAKLGPKAMLAGALASCLTATIAGLLIW